MSNKSKNISLFLLFIFVLLPNLTACGNSTDGAANDIPEEKLALDNFIPLFLTTSSVSYPEEGTSRESEDKTENPFEKMHADYNSLNKDEKIAYLRNMIEEALTENEAIGGVTWIMETVDSSVKDVFPDLYERIIQQDKQIKTKKISHIYNFRHNILTDENDQLIKVVELDLEKNLIQEKKGGANQTILFEHESTLEIITDENNKVKSATFIDPEGVRVEIPVSKVAR